jgi:hypothetical protein
VTAEVETKDSGHKDKEITLEISHNGVSKELEDVKLLETGAMVTQHAIALFPNVERPHAQALYRENATEEIPADKTVKEIGLKNKELLILRPRVVQGGEC